MKNMVYRILAQVSINHILYVYFNIMMHFVTFKMHYDAFSSM